MSLNRAGSLISRRWPSPRTRLGPGRRAPLSNDERPNQSAPSALPPARTSRAGRPFGSCLGAAREHTSGSGSGARSRARSWGATRMAHGKAPDHHVAYDALAPALSAPPVLTRHLAGQDGSIISYTLPCNFQSEVIQAREGAQVRAIKGSIGYVEVFQLDGTGISIIGKPRPLPGTTRRTPHATPTPSNAKSLFNSRTLRVEFYCLVRESTLLPAAPDTCSPLVSEHETEPRDHLYTLKYDAPVTNNNTTNKIGYTSS